MFHLDYLKLTIFSALDAVLNLVDVGLLERSGLQPGGWIEKGPADRWEHILYHHAGEVTLLMPKDDRITYCMVEIKGEGCSRIGAAALQGFLAYLNACDLRWHGRRVDLAFDHVKFTPHVVDAAIRAGNFNSRCLNIGDRDWNDSPSGQTAYLGSRRCTKTRRLRVYNKRGFVRFEAEFRKDWAASVVRELAIKPLAEWPAFALGHVRGMVDFVDQSSNPRIERCELLPWWADFVGNVERIRNLPEEDRRQTSRELALHVVGQSEARIARCARALYPIMLAVGGGYVLKRIEYYAKDRMRDCDEVFRQELAEYKYSGLAGLDTLADDIPF